MLFILMEHLPPGASASWGSCLMEQLPHGAVAWPDSADKQLQWRRRWACRSKWELSSLFILHW